MQPAVRIPARAPTLDEVVVILDAVRPQADGRRALEIHEHAELVIAEAVHIAAAGVADAILFLLLAVPRDRQRGLREPVGDVARLDADVGEFAELVEIAPTIGADLGAAPALAGGGRVPARHVVLLVALKGEGHVGVLRRTPEDGEVTADAGVAAVRLPSGAVARAEVAVIPEREPARDAEMRREREGKFPAGGVRIFRRGVAVFGRGVRLGAAGGRGRRAFAAARRLVLRPCEERRFARDRIHRAADRVAAVEHGRRAFHDIDPVNRKWINRPPILVRPLAEDRVVQPDSVYERQRAETREAANEWRRLP